MVRAAPICESLALTGQLPSRLGAACCLLPDVIDPDNLPLKDSSLKMFAAGMAITLGNPKIMVFYLALLPTIIDLRHLTLFGWGELVGIMLLVLIAVDVAWVLLAAHARLVLKSPRAVRIANYCSAGMMAAAASAIAAR